MVRSMVLASSLLGASAFKSYIMKVSQVIGGDNSHLLEIDTEAGTERVVNSDLTASTDFVKGSVVCGNTWYGVGSSFQAGGNIIAEIDVNTGNLTVHNVGGLWYTLKCGDQANEVYGVVAVSSPPQFGLVKATLAGEQTQTDIIGQFPDVLWGGWNSIFTFSGNELQANFPVQGKLESVAHGGEMYRMDVTTGNITMHKVYAASGMGKAGVPYFVKHTEGAMTTTGIFSDEELTAKLKLCQVDYTGTKAKVSKCQKLTEDWWASGALPLQCADDGMHYFPSIGGRTRSYEPLDAVSMDTGDLKEVYQIEGDFTGAEADYYLGAHACVQAVPDVIV